jgi:hypothetical protein
MMDSKSFIGLRLDHLARPPRFAGDVVECRASALDFSWESTYQSAFHIQHCSFTAGIQARRITAMRPQQRLLDHLFAGIVVAPATVDEDRRIP